MACAFVNMVQLDPTTTLRVTSGTIVFEDSATLEVEDTSGDAVRIIASGLSADRVYTMDVDAAASFVMTAGAQSIAGAKTFSDTMTINANLDVNGTLTTLDATNVEIADAFLELKSGSADGDFGIEGDDTGANPVWMWDDSEQEWVGGRVGSTSPAVLESGSGSIFQAWDATLDDIAALGIIADNQFMVGTGAGTLAYESGDTAAISMGVGSSDSPQFAGIELGHASANTLTASGGVLSIEGNIVYHAGGTDVPLTDGGTGASSAIAAMQNLNAHLNDYVTYNNAASPVTLGTADLGKIIVADTSGGVVHFDLPAASGANDYVYTIVREGGSNVEIDPGTDTINGSTSDIVMGTNYDTITIHGNGTDYIVPHQTDRASVASNLGDLGDVTLASIATNDFLFYGGAAWNASAYGWADPSSAVVIGDIQQASSTSQFSTLAAVATGNSLISGGVGTVSSWGKIGLTTHVTGTLPVTNGGTGLATIAANQMLYADGADSLAALTPGANQTLITSAGSVPSFSATLPTAVQGNITQVGTIGTGTWEGTAIANNFGGTGGDSSAATGVAQVSSGTWSYSNTIANGTFTGANITINDLRLNDESEITVDTNSDVDATTSYHRLGSFSAGNPGTLHAMSKDAGAPTIGDVVVLTARTSAEPMEVFHLGGSNANFKEFYVEGIQANVVLDDAINPHLICIYAADSRWHVINAGSQIQQSIEMFTGSGQSSLTLGNEPIDENHIMISYNGIVKYPTIDATTRCWNYTGSGTSIAIESGEEPFTGAEIMVIYNYYLS